MSAKDDDVSLDAHFCPNMFIAGLADHAEMDLTKSTAGYIDNGELIRLFADGRIERVLIRRLENKDCLGQA